MARFEDDWPAYVPVAERLRQAERSMDKLRKKGVVISPVRLEGKKIATTFWGKAWCDNLESYRDYANRVERGRTYVRNGSVVDLQIAPREVTAMVAGTSVYKVKVSIAEVPKAHWRSICSDCAGGIDSLVELLQGRFSKGVMERICKQGTGLFPKPADIRFSCSCPDHASMCKHVAAVLYGVGARLDQQPELLFRLRAVNEKDLIANIGDALPLTKQGPAAGKILQADDMAALFGLDMGDAGDAVPDATQAPLAPNVAARAKARPKPAASPPGRAGAPAAMKAAPARGGAAKPSVAAHVAAKATARVAAAAKLRKRVPGVAPMAGNDAAAASGEGGAAAPGEGGAFVVEAGARSRARQMEAAAASVRAARKTESRQAGPPVPADQPVPAAVMPAAVRPDDAPITISSRRRPSAKAPVSADARDRRPGGNGGKRGLG